MGEILASFRQCLDAPNYTLFSNTTSAQAYNEANNTNIMPLESPHNYMHLAVGGFDYPGQFDASAIPGANGDMGENDTAGLDPIFYFHHCFIDRVFWLWQQRHGATDDLSIVDRYPGTNSADSQGATPGVPANEWLSMDTPLEPFTRTENGHTREYVGRDGFNIQTQLGYTYGPGSLDEVPGAALAQSAEAPANEPKVHVTGIDRGHIRGSFLIAAFADIDGERKLIGSEAVLSRWHVEGCANCQTHLKAGATFPLHGLAADQLGDDAIQVEVRTRDGLLGGRSHGLTALTVEDQPHFRVEIR
jgi:tyrosinase